MIVLDDPRDIERLLTQPIKSASAEIIRKGGSKDVVAVITLLYKDGSSIRVTPEFSPNGGYNYLRLEFSLAS
ncbi:MAG: hypothetical protein A2Y57_04840 [Candidatus Woykebacteria bacterium RBG_13_40_7b]|uniref:Uncharacterized protein n=1 Tax=Candidatus Woykebacteria bacterium RBG_13_40_7b TaxID=1802594 RepID=A0A1G1WC06_9BACT|nr:MAG: hypothetical protein A2Y57_04840 [Candidatus Woykebacteria bacterium RBG_13_40_7b]